MATTFVDYTGDGNATKTFSFPSIQQSDIKVDVDGVIKSSGTHYNITGYTTTGGGNVVFIDNSGSGGTNHIPQSPAAIRIFRDTDVDSAKATYTAGSSVKAGDLNANHEQLLFAAQEEQNQTILSSDIKDGTIRTADIGADQITNALIADNQIDSEHYVDGSIDRVHLEADIIDSTKLADNAVNSEHYVDGSIDHVHLANDIIDGDNIQDDVINSEHYVAGSIDHEHLANDIIDGDNIQDDVINSEHYVAGSIDAEHLSSNSVTTAKIADNNVTLAKLGSGALPTDITVASANIVDGTIQTADIAADAVTNAKIADNSIDSEHYVDGSIDTIHIANAQISTAKIIDGAVTTSKLNDDAVTNAKLAANSVGTGKIIDGVVTTDKLNNGAVTSSKIAALNVTTGKIADDAVTTAKIADSSVTSAKIATNAVTTDKIADSELTTLAGMQSGTASKLADSTALTADIADLNQIDGLTKQTTITDSDASFPTSGAVVDYVAAQIAPIGGLEVIATEVAFPNTQPDAGVVISIADAGGIVVNGSGTSTTGRTVGGSTVTINNINSAFNSSTVDAGISFMVSSTGSGQVYNFHKATLKEADILNLSNDINDFANRYRVGSSNPTSSLDAGDLFFNTSTNKLLVYNATNTAWEEAQSIGNFFISTLSPAFDGSTQDFTITNAPANVQQIILSINGVVQKPNSGTSTPSEGFALSGSTVKLAAAPPTGSDYFAIVMGSTVNIGTPSNNTVTTAILQNGSVTTAKIADANVTTAKITDANVTTAKIADSNVTTAKIADSAVSTAKIADSAVTSAKIADGSIVNADINASAAIDGTKINPVNLANVAIGVSSPNYKLHQHVTNSGINYHQFTNTATGAGSTDGFILGLSGDEHALLWNYENTPFRLATNSTERVRVTESGNVGIGTTSPAELLHLQSTAGNTKLRLTQSGSSTDAVNGAIHFGNSTDGQLCEIRGYTSGSNNSGYLQFRTTNSGSDVTAMTINTAGNVGIGTSSPSVPSGTALEIKGSSVSRLKLSNDTTGTGATDGFQIYTSNNIAILENKENAEMRFYTNASEKIRITSAGMLEMRSDMSASGSESRNTIRFTDTDTSTVSDQALGRIQWFSSDSSGGGACVKAEIEAVANDTTPEANLLFKTHTSSATSPTERMRITGDGVVRIGHTSFTADTGADELVVGSGNSGANRGITILNNTGADGRICFGQSGDPDAGMIKYSHGSDVMQFFVESDEKVRIGSNGDIDIDEAIGQTHSARVAIQHSGINPSAALLLSAHSSFQGSTLVSAASRNTTNGSYVHFKCSINGVADKFRVLDNGNCANTNNSFSSLSDETLKENIVDAGSQWDDIKNIRVRKFNFKEGVDPEKPTLLGVIAQEAELVSPKLVESNVQMQDGVEQEYKTFKYSILYMKAVKCLQEAQTRIESLETRIAALEAA